MLIRAAVNGNIAVVTLLLDRGALVNARTTVREHGHVSRVLAAALLLRGASVR